MISNQISWTAGALLAFDLETTGVDPATARIVTATAAELGPGPDPLTRAITDTREWLVDPGIDIPESAVAIHGITSARARAEGMPAAAALQQIIDRIGQAARQGIPVVGHNVSYDLTVLHAEALRWHLDPPNPQKGTLGWVIDTLVMDKHMDRFRRGKRTLEVTAAHYGVPLTNAHDATSDAVAAARVAAVLGHRYPDLAGHTAEQLHALQADWKREQAASLQSYLRRHNPDAVVDGAWPVTL
ncbi:exonuclease domain-containing protein [Spelaeicoccus albus]|uniref:DNA polymerase-3 subunit epsilon n=1 Tax=Spelaeicoccus albus TaxID=1280376 RepID=A0A7Z0D3W4_9MICO|nr:exonuclease domain-containing protein [Spelaeicoccus albus]NYI68402.1 DNA polymerase-3 subunit epsilon [Spelaeicoccus albus]